MTSAPIDMSLRLWSEEIALAPILDKIGPSDVLHVRGELVPGSKGATPRIAPRHYASVAHERAWHPSDVDAWMRPLLEKMQDDETLMSLIEMRRIDGTFWIAILGERLLPMPKIDADLVVEAASLGLNIFLENYTDLEGGNPSRRWLPERPASAARAGSLRA